jgi:hypothetical protein
MMLSSKLSNRLVIIKHVPCSRFHVEVSMLKVPRCTFATSRKLVLDQTFILQRREAGISDGSEIHDKSRRFDPKRFVKIRNMN